MRQMPGADAFILRAAKPDDFAAMMEISVAARSRYRAIPDLRYVCDAPAVAEHRFHEGHAIVAVTPARVILGFSLTRPMDGLLLLDNISTSPKSRGQGVGNTLLHAVFNQAITGRYPAMVLTTFREPPWNSPWFRKFCFRAYAR
jgi:ribosomal protein S18 acetylase RimI-like enzyme